jgi:hypothetical protein
VKLLYPAPEAVRTKSADDVIEPKFMAVSKLKCKEEENWYR